jgi:hypothetical protein
LAAILVLPFLLGRTFKGETKSEILPGAVLGIMYLLFYLSWAGVGLVLYNTLSEHDKCSEENSLMSYFMANCIVSYSLLGGGGGKKK